MSAEYERVERLAAEKFPYGSRFDSYVADDRRLFIAGYLASKRLTDAEMAEKREQVARAIYWHLGEPEMPVDEFTCCGDEVLTALGFTRASEPGGDA